VTRDRGSKITFSFGKNWLKYVDEMDPAAIDRTTAYLRDWLGDIEGRSLLDVGSGSGLTSLAAHELGASVTSFDIDSSSVAATRRMREKAGEPTSWRIEQGSVLDSAFLGGLGAFDVVCSWGVLHHTGELWNAIDNVAHLVVPSGRLWIALYHRTRKSSNSLRTKRLYNRTPDSLKPIFRGLYAAPKLAKMALRRDFGPIRRYHEERGMSWWRDVEDWLGGLPYEVAGPGEVLERLRPLGFELVRLDDAEWEGDNDVYLFIRH
jgi:SAM-dependent methyltransferase